MVCVSNMGMLVSFPPSTPSQYQVVLSARCGHEHARSNWQLLGFCVLKCGQLLTREHLPREASEHGREKSFLYSQKQMTNNYSKKSVILAAVYHVSLSIMAPQEKLKQ